MINYEHESGPDPGIEDGGEQEVSSWFLEILQSKYELQVFSITVLLMNQSVTEKNTIYCFKYSILINNKRCA